MSRQTARGLTEGPCWNDDIGRSYTGLPVADLSHMLTSIFDNRALLLSFCNEL